MQTWLWPSETGGQRLARGTVESSMLFTTHLTGTSFRSSAPYASTHFAETGKGNGRLSSMTGGELSLRSGKMSSESKR